MSKLRVGWFFGGRSTEHEVSVITALQAYGNLNKEKYEVIPIYISKQGDFYTNSKFLELKNYKDIDFLVLSSTKITMGRKDGKGGFFTQGFLGGFTPLDLAFPLFHGSFGEDGSFQGLMEMCQIPYSGFNVLGGVVSMDKEISKAFFQSLGFLTAKGVSVQRNDWNQNSKKILKDITSQIKFPVFVKPADIGSTIGVNKANDLQQLDFNIEVAFTYSDKVIIEESLEGLMEVNCAALGYKEVIASVCEMPVRSGDSLSYADKYMKGSKGSKGSKGAGMASLTRQIPAPISQSLTKKIQDATVKIFKAMEGCGIARIDYFVDRKKETFYVNEVNSPPGSLAFYLFDVLEVGIKYPVLLDRIIEDGLKRFEDQKKTQFTFNSPLLSQLAQKGSPR